MRIRRLEVRYAVSVLQVIDVPIKIRWIKEEYELLFA